MNILSEAFNGALATALQGEQLEPLRPEDLVAKSRSDIELAVKEALSSSAVYAALSQPSLMHMLLLDMAKGGKVDQVRGALRSGADVHTTNEQGETALHLAAAARSASTVRVLLCAGADVHTYVSHKGTALHVAASLEDEASCLELLDWGADPHQPNHDGLSAIALMRADHMEPYARSFAHYHEAWTRRKQAASRLAAYCDGALPSLFWPPCYLARGWSESAHRHFPPEFRQVVRTLLLASRRRTEGEVACLPTELWFHVFRQMHRDWIPSEAFAPATPDSAPGRQPLRERASGSASASACGAGAPHTASASAPACGAGASSSADTVTASLVVEAAGGDEVTVRTRVVMAAAYDEAEELEPIESSDADDTTGALSEEAEAARLAEERAAAPGRLYAARRELNEVEQALQLLARVTVNDPHGEWSVRGPAQEFERRLYALREQIADLSLLTQRPQ